MKSMLDDGSTGEEAAMAMIRKIRKTWTNGWTA